MSKPQPVWVDCPGVTSEGAYGHSLRDNCWSCAPWWARIPTCPTHGKRLTDGGFCRECRRYYEVQS